ncbi:hypothetical protein [uncultured Desulfobulbus sp.]|uniref:hypothetical protein n=1 Tax=uncultured Desulfobulbus sp. TaxID=239745 RepID=UPI0029C6CD02|nr:hypothetical protein [uncultured Desulfobulbus sp.]
MLWQYRTILFEFTKDGLLGDKYVDDEEMEKTLNQLGGQSWELVDVTLLQDGVLAFLKRPTGEEMVVEEVVEAAPAAPPPPIIKQRSVAAAPKVMAVEQIQEEEPIRGLERQRKPTMHNDDSDFIGGIKIS